MRLFALVLFCGFALGAMEPQLIEAEASRIAPAVTLPDASGGQATTRTEAWQPLARFAAPVSPGPSVCLWLRHRHGPLQVKALIDQGQQRELQWTWARPTDWTWTRLGPFPAAEVAQGVIIIRGDAGADPAPELDAGCWTDPAGPAPADPPPAKPVIVAVDWRTIVGEAKAGAYGINTFRGYDPTIASQPAYQAQMRAIDPGLIRFHTAESMSDWRTTANSWLDHQTRTWHRERIAAALASYPRGNAVLMINICNWPAWMDADQDAFIDADQHDAYAVLCADLVRIVNGELGQRVSHWEITNELDDIYHNHLVAKQAPSRMPELARLFTSTAAAMKAVDPTIRTGGPAAIRPDLMPGLRLFAREARSQLDFFSYHAYASGSASDSDRKILGERIAAVGAAVSGVRSMLAEELPGVPVEHFLDEYNISWTWETRDPRMATHMGAVFDALVVIAANTAGVTGTAAWNEYDGIYGKMAPDFSLRPAGRLLALMNRSARGHIVRSTSSDPAIVAYAVQGHGDRRCVVLVNRSNANVPVQATVPSQASIERISERGHEVDLPVAALSTAPRYSVTVAVW